MEPGLESVIEDAIGEAIEPSADDDVPARVSTKSSAKAGGRKRPIRRKRKKAQERHPEPQEADERPSPTTPPQSLTSFMALAADFEAAIDDLEQREGWENLHTEFLRVFRRLEEVESREAGLQARVDALEGELEVARRALEPPARLRADSARVAQLQDEVVRLRAQCDSASAREHTALETLDGLRRHLVLVQQELHQAKGLKEDTQGMEHEKKSAKLQRERDILLIRLAALNERLAKAQDLQAELQRSASEKDLHLGKVQQQLAHEVERKQREMDARATLEAAYRALQSEVEARRNELNHVELQHKTAAIRAACLESTVAQLEEANDGLTKESADLAQRVAELKSLLRRRGLELDNAMASCQGVAGEMQHLEGSLAALEQKVSASESMNKALGGDLERARGRVSAVLADLARCKAEGRTTQRCLSEAQAQLATRERDVRGLDANRAALVARITRLTAELGEQVNVVAKKNAYIKELERSLEEERGAQERLLQKTEGMRHARDRLAVELSVARRRLDGEAEYAADERRAAERAKRDLADVKADLSRLKLRQDANEKQTIILGRQKAVAMEREDDMREQVKALTQVVEQVQEVVAKRDRELVAERRQRALLETARSELQDQVDRLQVDVGRRLEELTEQRLALKLCSDTVAELTLDRDAEVKGRLTALSERDVIGTQLARRNDEVSLLRRKVDTLERVLQAGGRELTRSQDAVRLLRLEVGRLRWERQLLSRSLASMPRLEHELYHAVQDVVRSQNLARALEDELSTPVNFHRWRRLEGHDLPHLQLLVKVRQLQRRLISRQEVVLQLETRVRETEALYLQLRQAFLRQPAANPTTLMLTRAALQDKERKIKGLLAEVSLSGPTYTRLEKANSKPKGAAVRTRAPGGPDGGRLLASRAPVLAPVS